MFRREADIQKLAEARSQVDLDAIADDAFCQDDEDEKKYEAFEAGFNLAKSAGTKDVYEVFIKDGEGKDATKVSYFFIGTKEEVTKKLEKVPVAKDEKPDVDEELTRVMEMEGQ